MNKNRNKLNQNIPYMDTGNESTKYATPQEDGRNYNIPQSKSNLQTYESEN
jgi:hypothetical protein